MSIEKTGKANGDGQTAQKRKKMEKYKITVSVPSTKIEWKGDVEERYIKAENLNDLLEKALTLEEMKNGVRIIRYEKYSCITKKYFFPLKVDFNGGYNYGIWDDYCTYDGTFALKYSNEIEEAFADYSAPEMVEYFEDYYSAAEKITSIKWGFEEKDGTLYGVVTAKMEMPLTEREENEFIEWISGQNSDGLGEGFEQYEIPIDNASRSHIYVHFWDESEDYCIWCENEEIDAKECAAEAPGWISVTEAIPEDQEEVLVCTLAKNGMRNIDKGYWAIDHFIHRGCARVTHWMPLPKFPKDDRGVRQWAN